MFRARLAIPIIGVIAASLVLPGVASANTATVTCDSTGVVFTYAANFGRSKVSTETVNGATYQYTVPVYQVSTHTWPGVSGDIVVSATWSGGSIPKTTLHCPVPPPPPTPPTPPPAPPVAPPVPPAPPPAPPVAPPAVPVTPSAPVTPSTPLPAPKISLRKRALAKTVPAGSTVRYQIVVKATGGLAHDVIVCDTLPAHMTYVALGTATLEDGKACWHVGDLTGSLTLSLKAKVDVGTPTGSLTNTAKATSSNAGNAKASATVNVPAKHGVKGKLKRTAGVTG